MPMFCTTTKVKTLFNQKFTRSQTKTKAIITKVAAPFAKKKSAE
jgi:hypothetical protein